MIFFSQPKILAVGINGRTKALLGLPVLLFKCDSAVQAAKYLRGENADCLICQWHLEDMPNGLFLKRLKVVKPDIKTIVFVNANNLKEEIWARSCGANVVLNEQTTDEFFRKAVVETMKLSEVIADEDEDGRAKKGNITLHKGPAGIDATKRLVV